MIFNHLWTVAHMQRRITASSERPVSSSTLDASSRFFFERDNLFFIDGKPRGARFRPGARLICLALQRVGYDSNAALRHANRQDEAFHWRLTSP
jgi:hypothetical protein